MLHLVSGKIGPNIYPQPSASPEHKLGAFILSSKCRSHLTRTLDQDKNDIDGDGKD